MLGIAWAFSYLNRIESNAGASYAWVAKVLHPGLGFIAGWSLVISATIFMVAGSLPAGSVTLSLFSSSAANNTGLVTLVGSVWFLVMVAMVILGVRVTARAQWIMSGIEVAVLVLFAVLAIVHSASHHVTTFSWSWFGLSHFHGLSGFAAGGLIAAFYYWGWDVSSNLNEEMHDSKRSAGLGGIIGVFIVFALYEIFTIATNLVLTGKTVSGNAGDVLSVLGQDVWPGVGGKLMVIAVMLSTIATLETTLIQVTRTLFAMPGITRCRASSPGSGHGGRPGWRQSRWRSSPWACSSARTTSARLTRSSVTPSPLSVCRSPSITASPG
jgi:amino acid transporter